MESKKVWRRWIAFVLCTAMTLSLFPQQSARADAPCEQHDYEGVEPEWVVTSDDAGGFTAAAALKCAKCGEAVSVSSDDKENMIVTPEDAKPAVQSRGSVHTWRQPVFRMARSILLQEM